MQDEVGCCGITGRAARVVQDEVGCGITGRAARVVSRGLGGMCHHGKGGTRVVQDEVGCGITENKIPSIGQQHRSQKLRRIDLWWLDRKQKQVSCFQCVHT